MMAAQTAALTMKAEKATSFRLGIARITDYWMLTKPEVNLLILITTSAGFWVGCSREGHHCSFVALFNALVGTLLVASGTGTLNQYIERRFDGQMHRTARRPAAAGRIKPEAVLSFGISLAAIGTVYLAVFASALASLLGLLTVLSYLFLYTPLKRRTSLCVVVGAFPGAMPPLIGWAAASEHLNKEAAILYAILFLWQFPHFMAIAWMYREDYDRADYQVLPRSHKRVPVVIAQTMLPLVGLIAISALQFPQRYAAIFYCAAILLGLGFLYFGLKFVVERTRKSARRLLAASIVYLPLVVALSATLCR